jgi:hypothetical protein
MALFAQAGIMWAEIGNEPNLEIEWKSQWHSRNGVTPMRHTNPEAVSRVAQTWVRDAQRAMAAGVKPAFYAFAPTDWRGNAHPLYSSVFYTRKVVQYLATHHRAETIDIFRRGGWIAVHAATYEQPANFDIHRPDGSVWDMTLRSYEVVLEAFSSAFGSALDLNQIPVMSTEGGVFTPDSTSMSGHDRLHSDEEHAQRVVEMFRWSERHSPLQAICPWCLSVGGIMGHFDERFRFDGWITEVNGQLPRRKYKSTRGKQCSKLPEVRAHEAAAFFDDDSVGVADRGLGARSVNRLRPQSFHHAAQLRRSTLARQSSRSQRVLHANSRQRH